MVGIFTPHRDTVSGKDVGPAICRTTDKEHDRPGWAALEAVEGGRVVPLDDDVASRWGPRLVDLLAAVAGAIAAPGGG